jgi:ornithine carbamoyltransferase
MSGVDNRRGPRNLLRIADLASMEVKHLLDLATEMKSTSLGFRKSHAGMTLACCVAASSPRTRVPLEVAAWRLGMLPIAVPPEELRGDGDSAGDIAALLSGYVDAVAVRGFPQRELERFAESARVPVVNAGTDEHDPCRALADLLTLRERFGELSGLHQLYLGDGMNVAAPSSLHVAFVGDGGVVSHSVMEAGALAGLNVVVATPPGREPDAQIQTAAAEEADARGGCVRIVNDPGEAVRGADAVYTCVWAEPEEVPAPYRVDAELMALAKPGAVFMHRLPAQRGREVTEEVIDGPQSLVLQQAANLLPAEQAVLHALLTANWPG